MELQSEIFGQAMVKFDLPAERYTLSVVLDGLILQNLVSDRLIRHCHGRYEVLFQWSIRDPDNGSFRIIPPGVWHTGRMKAADGELQVTPFGFIIHDRTIGESEARNTYGPILENFLQLTAETTVADTFGGSGLIHAIRREVEKQEDACVDRIHALFHLLMVDLARHLPGYQPKKRKAAVYTAEDFIPERIDWFLIRNYGDPACSRELMARHLNVSERQLARILEQIYHKPFRQLLLEHRMEFAEAWRVSDGLTAAETAQKVGYTSVSGFCNAYEKYHGRKYQKNAGQN